MRRPVKKTPQPVADSVYNSVRLSRFVNYIMLDGKKSTARKIVYDALDRIKKNTKKDPLEVFETALHNVGPTMEVRSRRVGGANYQVPREVRPERRDQLAMRWIVNAVRAETGRPMYERLADEILAAANEEGTAFAKKENTHKMAEANKAFAHFAW
ncbi:MAG: 30S ribosomal protein S7 [Candidatus Campbellbacteria bacterium]|nr:30S ribosomal protein S7 [Candidatus Campbellbacteria bacterium]